MLTRRLKIISRLVVASDNVIDIGTDHGLLPIYLVKNNLQAKVIASDISEKALENAKKNILKYNLEENIKLKVGDGLTTVDDDTDTAVISGMGATSIIKILSSPKLKQIKKLIIQSNNDHHLLRSFLVLKGFYISHESVIYEKGHYYINIVFQRGHRKYKLKELMYGPILMNSNKDYYEYLLKKKISILENIPRYKVRIRFKHQQEKILLKKLIKKIP